MPHPAHRGSSAMQDVAVGKKEAAIDMIANRRISWLAPLPAASISFRGAAAPSSNSSSRRTSSWLLSIALP
jgi:hypothetical protein